MSLIHDAIFPRILLIFFNCEEDVLQDATDPTVTFTETTRIDTTTSGPISSPKNDKGNRKYINGILNH